MSLDEYRSKRNFTYSPEPTGRARRGDNKRIFVVQKHAASRLHYDFRLAINGVLVSWAIPRGPSMKPADKRLAVRTEDHPLAYADFEGVIPEGQYGAGTVMIWDTGPYDTQDGIAPERQLAQGKIDVQLHGTRLRGGFTLVHTGSRSVSPKDKERWLLIKQRDAHADSAWDIEDPRYDRSVLTGRTMREIESARRRIHVRAS